MNDRSARLPRLRILSLAFAATGICLSLSGWMLEPGQFFRSWLFAYLVCLQLALGCFALLMVSRLTGGDWGEVLRGSLESGAACLPWMALGFVPIGFGMREVFPWARPETMAASAKLMQKAAYLNVPFFLGRAACYFAVWTVLVHFLRKWLRVERQALAQRDDAMLAKARKRAAALSAPGLILFGITVHFAAFDWGMSLEPEWHSTMYGFLIISGEAPAVLSLMILSAAWLDRRDALSALVSPARLYDLGNLLLAFVLIWAYIQFMQFLIIWSGNLPEEIAWYLHRIAGGWKWIALLMFLAQFASPFLLLLFRSFKSRVGALAWLALGLMGIHVVNVYWLVAPAFHPEGMAVHWLDAAALAAVGGAWAWKFSGGLARSWPETAEGDGSAHD
ncbi:MAG: hypothetical protein JWO30_4923 [Fibrobacteres bacterium]|nr:hypothetical protein [Fibrobacterota bacterium]